MEESAIANLEKTIPKLENPKVATLLKAIMADERRHHKLLQNLYHIVVEGDAVTGESPGRIGGTLLGAMCLAFGGDQTAKPAAP